MMNDEPAITVRDAHGVNERLTSIARMSQGLAAESRRRAADATLTDRRLQPRFAQQQLANACGLFWLPCPICREPFGGHEWAGDLYLGDGCGQGVCANCVDEAERRSALVRQTEAAR